MDYVSRSSKEGQIEGRQRYVQKSSKRVKKDENEKIYFSLFLDKPRAYTNRAYFSKIFKPPILQREKSFTVVIKPGLIKFLFLSLEHLPSA